MNASRTLITLDELSNKLTEQLQQVDGAGESRVTVQYILQEPDADGCNWSDSVVLTLDKDTSSKTLGPFVTQLVQAARMKFNVKE